MSDQEQEKFWSIYYSEGVHKVLASGLSTSGRMMSEYLKILVISSCLFQQSCYTALSYAPRLHASLGKTTGQLLFY